MSKKYFTKWVVVDEEIEKGDKIAFEGNMNEILTYPDSVTHLKYSDKKVKLFLCSSQIEPGDKVIKLQGTFDEGIGTVVEVHDDKVIVQLDDELDQDDNPITTVYKLRHLAKQIGPVSPTAKWVKEGDEFDEEEVRYNKTMTMLGQKDEDAFYYLIKCPCCGDFK